MPSFRERWSRRRFVSGRLAFFKRRRNRRSRHATEVRRREWRWWRWRRFGQGRNVDDLLVHLIVGCHFGPDLVFRCVHRSCRIGRRRQIQNILGLRWRSARRRKIGRCRDHCLVRIDRNVVDQRRTVGLAKTQVIVESLIASRASFHIFVRTTRGSGWF